MLYMHDDNRADYEEQSQMTPEIVCLIIRHATSHVSSILRSVC